jgi:hypothetical protein
MGMNSVNTWIQATDRANLALGYPLSLNPNGGNVGIGTPSPGVPLHVEKTGSTSAVQEFLRLENHALGGVGAGSSINFHHYHAGNGPTGGAKAASITAQNMASWPAGSPSSYSTGLTFSTLHENTFDERMRITSAGKVGIGSSSSLDSSLNLNNNQAFARVFAADNSGTLRVGQRHVANNSNSLVIMGATHNTYYPASFVVDSSYANNTTTYDLTAYGVAYPYWYGAMSFKISNGASSVVKLLSLTAAGAVFNEDSADVDFRVASNLQANMLKVDAGNDIVNFNSTQTTSQQGAGYRLDGFQREFQRDTNVFSINQSATSGTGARTRRLIIQLHNYGPVKITIMNGGHLYNNGGAFGFRETTFYVAMETTSFRINSKVDGVNAGTYSSSYGVPTIAANGSEPRCQIDFTVAAQMTCSTYVKVEGYGANKIISIADV